MVNIPVALEGPRALGITVGVWDIAFKGFFAVSGLIWGEDSGFVANYRLATAISSLEPLGIFYPKS